MRKLPLMIGALVAFAAPALATDDVIATRQALMDNNGAHAALAGAILKGEIDYSPVIGNAAIYAFRATAFAYGDYFPEGSLDPTRSHASPKIWEDMAGFQEEIAKFQKATAAAHEAGGKNGPADKAAFAGLMKPIFDSCKSCHESYRVKDN